MDIGEECRVDNQCAKSGKVSKWGSVYSHYLSYRCSFSLWCAGIPAVYLLWDGISQLPPLYHPNSHGGIIPSMYSYTILCVIHDCVLVLLQPHLLWAASLSYVYAVAICAGTSNTIHFFWLSGLADLTFMKTCLRVCWNLQITLTPRAWQTLSIFSLTPRI